MSQVNKLVRAAVESVDAATIEPEEVFVDHELQPVTAPTLEEGDSIFSQEEGYVLAAEALQAQAFALETLLEALKKVPEASATPEIIEVVKASILLPSEPAIAEERFNNDEAADGVEDVTDVKSRTVHADSVWERTKGHAEKSAKTLAAAVKQVLKTIIDFLQGIWDWIVTSRRSIQKELEAQKSKISSGPQSTNVSYIRNMKPLTYGDAFGADAAKSSMNRYAEVLAACTYAIQDVLNFTGSFKTATFNPEALQDFATHFRTRTSAAFKWDHAETDSSAQIFDGEGGQSLSMSVKPWVGVSIHSDDAGGETSTSENAFSRSDMIDINRRALTLMKGVAVCEPEIKKVQNSLRSLMALDAVIGVQVRGKSPTVIWLAMRSYLSFANRIGVGMAVKAAAAAAHVGRAYLAGGPSPANSKTDNEAHGELVQKQLGMSAA